MHKLALVAAVSAVVASPSFAAYTGTATSGTAANPLASISVVSGGQTKVWYVDNALSSASNITTPAIQLVKASDWTFDFTDLGAVTFIGNIQYGDYKTQTTAMAAVKAIDGRQTFVGVTQAFSGIGSYNEATNTFTFTKALGAVNAGGASVQTQTSSSCADGATALLGKVCGSFSSASKPWEGLSLSFVFSEDRSSFSGTLVGTDTSGTGVSLNTTTINWQIAGTESIVTPVPAAVWLFGSGLLGLAGAARRRRAAA